MTYKDPVLAEFTCDITQSDCKINFDFSSSFTGGFSASDYVCSLDFGIGNLTGEESKCNPSTVVFTGSADYIVHAKIIQKADSNIFAERIFTIHSGHILPDTSSGTVSSSGMLSNSGVLDNSGTTSNSGIITQTG